MSEQTTALLTAAARRKEGPPPTRSELLSLLTEACELEHGLACSYLYAAFSLKQDLHEGGLTWQQLQDVRKWASQVYFVASQEMLHLAQVWNLLAAIGGTPYYLRPNFPQNSNYYPAKLALKLEPFGIPALRRFVFYEHPAQTAPHRYCTSELGVDGYNAEDPPFTTVGELYGLILEGFLAIPEEQLFVGAEERQVGPELVDFPNIVKVVDRDSAGAAIHEITEQGEGTQRDRTDCHYGMFLHILEQLTAAQEQGDNFAPARHTLINPAAKLRGDYGADKPNIIEDPATRRVAELFDAVYILMLRLLSYVFSNSTGDAGVLRAFSTTAIRMMPTVLQPLGEVLTLLPAGERYAGRTAGPAFGMSRHVALPPDPRAAWVVAHERLQELTVRAGDIAEDIALGGLAPAQIGRIHGNMTALLDALDAK
jgi:hypothetical protein